MNSDETESGMRGYLPSWIKCAEFDPGGGLQIAHDFFEHRLRDSGLWHEELMAFGAMYVTRYKSGWFSLENPAEELGEELIDLWLRSDSRDTPIQAPGRSFFHKNGKIRSCDRFRLYVDGLLDGMSVGFDDKRANYSLSELHRPKADWWESARYWIDQGAQNADLKYRGTSAKQLSREFDVLMHRTDRIFNRLRHDDCSKSELKVSFDRSSGSVQVLQRDPLERQYY